jgi:hypothetical protein
MMKERRSRTEKHMTRKELLKAAGQKEATAAHLQDCAECREAVALLRAFQMTGRPSLADPPRAWVERAAAIPQGSWRTRIVARLQGVITFDSWLQPEPVGVRGAHTSDERRVCCEAGPYIIDLRAEKNPEGWRVVAQLTGEGSDAAELRSGSQVIAADHDAMFQWSSQRPPSSISVQVGESEIEFPKLSWKRPSKK